MLKIDCVVFLEFIECVWSNFSILKMKSFILKWRISRLFTKTAESNSFLVVLYKSRKFLDGLADSQRKAVKVGIL